MSNDAILRLNAALESRYRIERQLGEGGMATVYLADDLKHERKVALKVLKPELAAVVGADRFLAEIKTTANLQHPHILPLFDSGEADSFLFYVMPYIEGESLRERLEREKQLPVDEAVRIATDVAEALHSAHKQGVIHRDIKPANILLSDGRPLVADFGIALAVSQAGGGRLTETGLSMGTPHYMSPEQATGDQGVGPTTDIYALGCVLYEMLVGEPPYTGSTAQAILGKIIAGELASATKHRRSVPANLDAAIRKALEKLPADRFTGVHDFSMALADPGFRHGEVAVTAATASAGRWNQVSATFASLFALASALAAWGWLRPAPTLEPGVSTRAQVMGVQDPAGGRYLGISPDGRWIAAAMDAGAGPAIYLRSAEEPEWRPLANTEGGRNPTFSPDGLWVAFDVALTEILKVPISGGPALPVALGNDPHWAANDQIVFRRQGEDGALYRVGSSGGEPDLLLASDSINVVRPHLLPDGRAVVFSEQTSRRIMLLDIETGDVREIAPYGHEPNYLPTGHVIYGHDDGALLGVKFDAETLEASGSPVTILPRLRVATRGASQFAVSTTGTLIYDASALAGNPALVEWDLSGAETQLPLAGDGFGNPRYSPDGRQIAYQDGADIRVYDAATGASPLFASGAGFPVWSATGEYLYFQRDGDIYRRRADFGAEAELLSDSPQGQRLMGVSPDDSLAVVVEGRGLELDIRLMRRGTDGVEFVDLVATDWTEQRPSISPDGRWLAYTSNQSGENRIYVHSFPVPTGQYPVSPGFGVNSRWSPDGRTLYYRSRDQFMAVDVTAEPSFRASTPRVLFDRFAGQWDVHPDGARFVLVSVTQATDGDVGDGGVYLVTNWFTELCDRMGGC